MILILLLLLIVPREDVVETRVDFVELNHFHCEESGKLIFTQRIWWNYEQGQPIVVAWRMEKNEWRGVQTDMLFHDGDTLRRVRAGFAIETWTTYDPELRNREVLAKEFRRELGRK